MKTTYLVIGFKSMGESLILGAFGNKEDAENFANDFDKKHCDANEDDLYYSDEDYDDALDWCQDTWYPERWDENRGIPKIVPDDFELDKLIHDIKLNEILYENWEPSVVYPIKVIDAYEGLEKMEEIYLENRVKIDDLF